MEIDYSKIFNVKLIITGLKTFLKENGETPDVINNIKFYELEIQEKIFSIKKRPSFQEIIDNPKEKDWLFSKEFWTKDFLSFTIKLGNNYIRFNFIDLFHNLLKKKKSNFIIKSDTEEILHELKDDFFHRIREFRYFPTTNYTNIQLQKMEKRNLIPADNTYALNILDFIPHYDTKLKTRYLMVNIKDIIGSTSRYMDFDLFFRSKNTEIDWIMNLYDNWAKTKPLDLSGIDVILVRDKYFVESSGNHRISILKALNVETVKIEVHELLKKNLDNLI